MEILFDDEKFEPDNYFIASKDPYYIGIIINPSSRYWELFVNSKEVIINNNGDKKAFKISYRIDVGENSIFFLTQTNE